jgi:magnesium transporter
MADRRDGELEPVLSGGSPESLAASLRGLHPADIAAALERLDAGTVRAVLAQLDTETAADVIIHLDENSLEDVLETLEPPEIADIATELESDDAADVIGALDAPKQAEVLSELEQDERREVEELLKYKDESAGGIMAAELAYVKQGSTVDDAIGVLRAAADDIEDIHNVYVTDASRRLIGVLPIRSLVLARPGTRIADIMNPDVVSVSTEMDQEQVAEVFRKYDVVAVPVVDPSGVLIGRITVDDIIDVIHEEADEDISRMAGTSEEELHEDSALKVSRIRLPWLVVGALGGLGSATVMNHFRLSLEKVLALAFFVPVITAMGGNVGLQTSTIIVRSMRSESGFGGETLRRLLREWRIAFTNAVILGVSIYLIVGLWLGDWRLATLVGGSLSAVILVAATLGTVMPFALRRLGIDPAVAQGPFVTTLNDVIGILVYLGLASAFIDLLE